MRETIPHNASARGLKLVESGPVAVEVYYDYIRSVRYPRLFGSVV